MDKVKVYIEVLDESVMIPEYSNMGDSGMDIRANEDILIYPEDTVIIPTGIKVSIPKGYEIQVRARSGISLKTPLRVANGIGTIDSNYKDELGIIVHNSSSILTHPNFDYSDGCKVTHDLNVKNNEKGIYIIRKGDRIAQIVLQKVPMIEFEKVDDITKYGENRNGGFGSTGVK